MKTLLFTLSLLVILTLAPLPAAQAAEAKEELQTLVAKVKTKLDKGDRTEAALAPELKEFDALLAAHKEEKTDDVAQILAMQAMLYAQVIKDEPKAITLLQRLQTEFPETAPGKKAPALIEQVQKQAEQKKPK